MSTSSRDQRSLPGARVAGRVRSALGTRGQRSHPVRPQADVHRIFRLQPPPFV